MSSSGRAQATALLMCSSTGKFRLVSRERELNWVTYNTGRGCVVGGDGLSPEHAYLLISTFNTGTECVCVCVCFMSLVHEIGPHGLQDKAEG